MLRPDPLPTTPLRLVAADWLAERRARGAAFPAGDTDLDFGRVRRLLTDPLGLLLDAYRRHGPVFTLRLGYARRIFALGPEANHDILVAHADQFRWRDSAYSDLVPLAGDGLIAIDGDFHRHVRQALLPAFHREAVVAAHAAMRADTERSVARWEPGTRVDVHAWARELTFRLSMRLSGFEPDAAPGATYLVSEFERAFGFLGADPALRLVPGPGTPYARFKAARRRIDAVLFDEIARRRRTGERRADTLSLLLDAGVPDGAKLTDREVRDQLVTLLLGGYGTSSAVLAFLFYELARHPEWAMRIAAEVGALGGEPGPDQLLCGGLPSLDLALAETLRLYTPSWLGPRKCSATCTVAGVPVPAGVHVAYSSWVSHRLPDVWEDAGTFRPERFAPGSRARIPRGAYVPFGGGSRSCLGMRFVELELRTIAARVLRDFRLELAPGYSFAIDPIPMLKPKDGLPMVVAR